MLTIPRIRRCFLKPAKRMGYGPLDATPILKHPFFRQIDLEKLIARKLRAPIELKLETPLDLRYFDLQDITNQSSSQESRVEQKKSLEYFSNFTYVKP